MLVQEEKITGFEKKDKPGQDFLIKFQDKIISVEIKSSYNGEFFHKIKYNNDVIVIPLKTHKISPRKEKRKIMSAKIKIIELINDL